MSSAPTIADWVTEVGHFASQEVDALPVDAPQNCNVDKSLVEQQVLMAAEAEEAECEEDGGLTAVQAIRVLELCGVRFEVMEPEQFNNLLSSSLPGIA